MSDISNDEVVQSRKRKNPFRIPISADESDDSETDSEIDFSSASEFGDEISSDSFSEEDDRIEMECGRKHKSSIYFLCKSRPTIYCSSVG